MRPFLQLSENANGLAGACVLWKGNNADRITSGHVVENIRRSQNFSSQSL